MADQEPGTTTPEKDDETTTEEVTLESLQLQMKALSAQNTKLETTNERLLTESKSNKTKWQLLRDEQETAENTKLSDQEDWKTLVTKLKGEKKVENEKFQALKAKTLRKTLDFEVARWAKDAHSVDDIIHSLPSTMVDINEETFSIEGVQEAVNFLRDEKPYLFSKSQVPGTVNNRPTTEKPKVKELSEMSIAEKVELLKAGLSQTITR